jgi:hypothetical protein
MPIRTCPEGHRFEKTSDCPTCPQCEAAKKPSSGFLARLGAPAFRALKNANVTTLKKLAALTEKDVLALHGMGKGSLPTLRKELAAAGLAFKVKAAPVRMKNIEADTPDEYVAAVKGWQHDVVVALRKTVRAAAPLDEVLNWGHLVYLTDGPVLLIRAEPKRVLFGFWRGKRLRDIEPRLKPGGKYDMATLELRESDAPPSAAVVKRLVRAAVALQ